jgi:hypothetical protein
MRSTSSPLSVKKRSCSVDLVHAPGLDFDVRKPGGLQLGYIILLLEGAGDASDPELHAATDVGRHVAADDHVGHREPPLGLSTRNASRSTASLSPDRLMTQFEMMTSTESSGSETRPDA